MKSSVPYKTINIVASLVCVASIGAMEQGFVSSQEMKDLSQSIMMAKGEVEPSLKGSQGSRGWFAGVSDWWNGLDTNVVSELKEGTLTKDLVAQDKELQKRAYDAIGTAIEKKRTENLCTLLNQLSKFEMFDFYVDHNDSITQFLNTEIALVCEQKACTKLINILQTMKATQLVIDDSLLNTINNVLDEGKECDIQKFKKVFQSTQEAMIKVQEQMIKDRTQYKDPLLEAQEILLLQKYLAGNQDKVKKNQVKKELGVDEGGKALDVLFNAIKIFVEKK